MRVFRDVIYTLILTGVLLESPCISDLFPKNEYTILLVLSKDLYSLKVPKGSLYWGLKCEF